MPKAKKKVPPKTPRRLKPAERERLILDEAKRYFAERGLSGGTEELAQRLGVTQPLLFRYFPTKAAMIERIFRDIEVNMFNPDWPKLIGDTALPIEERLYRFYRDYFNRVLTRDHFRLFLYAGLAWTGRRTTRDHSRMRGEMYPASARAIRAEISPQASPTARITKVEMEMVQSLHAMMYHLAVRRWVFGPPIQMKNDEMIRLKVAIFLGGVRSFA